MNSNEIIKISDENLMPTYAHFNLALSHGKGAKLYDFSDKEYIDFTSGIGVNSLGICNDGWVKAVSEQAATLQHTSNLYYTQPAAELSAEHCKRTGMGAVFFGNSGAEANECAIKLARKYSSDKYGENRGTVVTLVNSFHGRTLATVKATGQEVFHKYFYPFPGGFEYTSANDAQQLEKALNDNVCALIVEIVQGEGGVLPLDADFVCKAQELCKEKDILFIVDEVQTGIGRTGKLFAYENYGLEPDVVTSAKGLGGGLPIGACLCSKELAGVMSAGTHGSTYGGNPVVCAGANEVIKNITEEFLGEVKKKGEYLKSKLLEIPEITQVRGMGLMLGASLKNKVAKEVVAACIENGVLVLTAKDSLRFLPPLTITYDEIDEGVKRLSEILNA